MAGYKPLPNINRTDRLTYGHFESYGIYAKKNISLSVLITSLRGQCLGQVYLSQRY